MSNKKHETWPDMAEYIVQNYRPDSPERSDAEFFLSVLSYFHHNADVFKKVMTARGWSIE